jgi:hypothetical protein
MPTPQLVPAQLQALRTRRYRRNMLSARAHQQRHRQQLRRGSTAQRDAQRTRS